MHVTLVKIAVKPECVDAFIAATSANHEGSVREPGCRRFDVLQSPDNPGDFVLYEAYADAAAAAAHKQTSHYAAWRDAVADMMASPRQGIAYAALFPRG